jgi:hypothetical protein
MKRLNAIGRAGRFYLGPRWTRCGAFGSKKPFASPGSGPARLDLDEFELAEAAPDESVLLTNEAVEHVSSRNFATTA